MAKGKAGDGLIRVAMKFMKKADFQRTKRAAGHRLEPHQLRHMMQGSSGTKHFDGLRSGPGKYGTRTGYHYRPGGQDFPGRRILPPPNKTHPSGAYDVRTQFEVDQSKAKDGSKMVWTDKKGPGGSSTFFPDHWTPQQVDGAVSGAFQNGTFDATKGTWKGIGPDGLKIEGRFDPNTGGIVTAYPVID